MAKTRVRLKSSVTAQPVAPKLAGPNTKLMPHIQARKELNDLRDALTDGKITREQYEEFYPPLADKLFEVQEKNGFEMGLDGIKENYYKPPPFEIDPTAKNLLGPLPNSGAQSAQQAPAMTQEMIEIAAHNLAVMDAQDKVKAEAAAAAAQGPPRFQSARERFDLSNRTEEDNPLIAPNLSPAQQYGQPRTTPTIQPIMPTAATPAVTTQPMIPQAAPQTAQPQVAQAVHPMMQKLSQAAQPTAQPAQPQPTLPNKNSAYWHLPIPKLTFANAGQGIKYGTQFLGGAGLMGATLVGGNALYKLLGTSQPPERTLEEEIDSNPIFNYDPSAARKR